jgi:hypothetical protein
MLFAQIPRRGCHDGTLSDHDLTILFERLADVILADEVRWTVG